LNLEIVNFRLIDSLWTFHNPYLELLTFQASTAAQGCWFWLQRQHVLACLRLPVFLLSLNDSLSVF